MWTPPSLVFQLVGHGKTVARLLDAPRILRRHLVQGMERVGQGLERHVKTQKLSGQALDARTGNLRRAIFHSVREEKDDVVGVVGADLGKAKYARLQELGGTITPKRSRFLTIPLREALTGKGVAKFSARDVIANPGSFGYTGTFFARGFLFGRTDGNRIVPLFALRTQVTIKAVGYLAGTVSEKKAWAVDALRKAVSDGVEEIRRG